MESGEVLAGGADVRKGRVPIEVNHFGGRET